MISQTPLYPCPLCGKSPLVEARRTQAGTLWVAWCDCFAAHSSDPKGLEYSWTMYCVKMAEEAGA